jgi:hypothetical protein
MRDSCALEATSGISPYVTGRPQVMVGRDLIVEKDTVQGALKQRFSDELAAAGHEAHWSRPESLPPWAQAHAPRSPLAFRAHQRHGLGRHDRPLITALSSPTASCSRRVPRQRRVLEDSWPPFECRRCGYPLSSRHRDHRGGRAPLPASVADRLAPDQTPSGRGRGLGHRPPSRSSARGLPFRRCPSCASHPAHDRVPSDGPMVRRS